MKKKILISLLSVVLLAGCSLFGEKKPDPVSDGAVSNQDNFDYITEEMNEKWTEKVISLMPNFTFYEKSKSSLQANASISAPEVGNIDIEVSYEENNDIENMLGTGDFSIKGSMDMSAMGMAGQTGSAMAKLATKTMEDKVFFSLSELDIDLGGQEAMIEPIFEPYVGVWYGGSLQDLENILGTGVNIEDFKNSIDPEKFNFRKNTEEALNQMDIWKLSKGMETKNGMLYFEVELDKVALKKGLMGLVDVYLIMPDEELAKKQKEEAGKAIDAMLAEVKNASGVLGISQDNPEYFTFEGTVESAQKDEVVNIEISWLEENKKIQASPEGASDDEVLLFEMTTTKGVNNFSLSNLDKSEVMLKGESSDDKLEFTFTPEPNFEDESVKVDLDKKNDSYSGKVEITSENVVIDIAELKFDKDYIKADFDVTSAGQKLASISAEMTTEELSKVEVSEPENYKTFEELMTSLQGLMGPMMMNSSAPGMDDDMMYDDEYDLIEMEDMEMYQ